MLNEPPISRRRLLRSGAATVAAATFGRANTSSFATSLQFALPEGDLHMQVEFHDKVSAGALRLLEISSHQQFCLSHGGLKDRDCLAGFSGSLAIAHYRLTPRRRHTLSVSIREYVRTIDRDARLPLRSPFELTIPFEQGVASDVQAFGTESVAASQQDTWCILRQDLFLYPQTAPFLILHWKHTLRAIRILDVVLGDRTRLIKQEALR